MSAGPDRLHQYCTNARTAAIEDKDFPAAVAWLERAFSECADAIAADAAMDGWITNFYRRFLIEIGRGAEARRFFDQRATEERAALANTAMPLERTLGQPTAVHFDDLAFAIWLYRHDYISNDIRAGRLWEPDQCRRMRAILRPGDGMIDIGANIGWHSLIAAAAVGPEGRVLAFEPDPINHRLLSASASANRFDWLEAYPLGIGAEHGTGPLHRPALGNNGQHSLIETGAPGESVMIDVAPLDSMIALIDRPIRCLKMDIEGFEARALQGMAAILASHLAPEFMLIEFSPVLLHRAGDGPEAFEHLMRDHGYTGTVIHQFNSETTSTAASLADLYHQTLASKTGYGAQYDVLFQRQPR